ncbi:DNA-binding protein [Dietzia maris]|uniref:DNA-binding protein n=1 Tax=Dietzia maris TaxID=37915 RepID=A0A365PBZ4_9ACTN|nr:DNA-binding protein [Dietzia maris]
MNSDFRPDPELVAVGERIRGRMPPGMTQAGLAAEAGMTSDALSRALNARRGFTTGELTRIAKVLDDADLHWLLTGRSSPHAVSFAARHEWDSVQQVHSNPGSAEDEAIIERIHAAYVAAYPNGAPASSVLPTTPDGVRALLGDGFASQFAERVEDALEIDVVRLAELSTSYSITIGDRHVIALRSERSWGRSNWSLAHEIGHLALSHHESAGTALQTTRSHEMEANAFAAELLLPSPLIDAHDWRTVELKTVLQLLWQTGVSGEALANRLSARARRVSEPVARALKQSTPALLREGIEGISPVGTVEVVRRQQAAGLRRVPASLEAPLADHVAAGVADPGILAWLRGVPVDQIDFPELSEEKIVSIAVDEFEKHPDREFWDAWLAGKSTAS